MYRRLLDICYTSEKPLTKDERQLFRLTRAATDGHREAMLTVLHEFFEETDEGWISRRAVIEIAAMQQKQQKQRDKANKMWADRKSALPRAESGNAPALPQHDETNAVALKHDANAMPPTPTPTPTPVLKIIQNISPERLTASEPESGFSIPLNDGSEHAVAVRTLAEWVKSFPAVDVEQELREMRVWAMANPTKRKTKRGIESFAVRWLAKAQDTPARTTGRQDDWTRAAV